MKKADVCFIKAVQKKYANDFYNNGLIYLNTLENYRDLEDKDTAVGDKMENIIFSLSIPDGEIWFSVKNADISALRKPRSLSLSLVSVIKVSAVFFRFFESSLAVVMYLLVMSLIFSESFCLIEAEFSYK